MSKMKVAAIALACLGLTSLSPAFAQTTFNVSTYAPYQHPLVSVALENWAKEVAKESGGKININILKTALGQPQAHYDLAVNGVADITLGIPGYTPGRFSVVEVAALPGVGDTSEALSVALWKTYEKFPSLQKEFEQVQVLGLMTTSPAHFHNAKRPINTMQDFSGLKSRVAGGVMSDVAKALGVTPVLQPAGKVYELLSGGVIDAVIFPQETLKSFKLEKLIKHTTLVPGGLTAVPIFLVMNKAKFAALSKADQEALMRASGERLSRINGVVWDERDQEGIDSLKKEGGQVAVANATLVKQINEATKDVADKWVGEVKTAANTDGGEILAYFRAEAKKAEPKKK